MKNPSPTNCCWFSYKRTRERKNM